jgi:transcriptional regulator GlxA family with amidase domain
MINTAILVFTDVEVLDFTGPFEVFSVASQLNDHRLYQVYTFVCGDGATTPVPSINGLKVFPDYNLAGMPEPDLLILPGGSGSRALTDNMELRKLVVQTLGRGGTVASVCTGARILAAAGLLDGLEATTHHTAIDEIASMAPGAKVRGDVRFTDNGPILTAAGVSAGIDLSLYLVERQYGKDVADQTARYMEWER